MIKRFCDRCGEEVVKEGKGKFEFPAYFRGKTVVTSDQLIMNVNVSWKFPNSRGAPDICLHCTIDAFNRMDDRPQITEVRLKECDREHVEDVLLQAPGGTT